MRSAERGLRQLPRLMELVRSLAVIGSDLGQPLLEALLPLIPRGFQLLLQGLDLGFALPLHRFDAGFELVPFVLKLVACVLDSRLEPGLPLRRGLLAFSLQRDQLVAVRGDLPFDSRRPRSRSDCAGTRVRPAPPSGCRSAPASPHRPP